MPALRFGLTISMYPPAEMVRAGVLAEKYGFDSVWAPDHLVDLPPSGDKVDPWVILSAVGVQTKRIMLSPDVTDVQRVHPAKTAHLVATLDELTGGRAALGIGAGEAMNITPYGLPWESPDARAERLREAVQIIRLLWSSSRGKPVDFKGRVYMLNKAWLDQQVAQKPAPPIYIGSLGAPRTLRLVGELADGWKPWFNTLKSFKRRLDVIKSAAEEAGRDYDAIDKVVLLFTAATEDEGLRKKAIDALKAEILVLNHRRILKELGFDVGVPADVVYQYQKVLATEEVAAVAAKTAEGMPDDVATRFMAVGGADECIGTIEGFIRAGATHVVLRDVIGQYVFGAVDKAEPTLKVFGEKIIPYFKGK